VNRAQRIRSRCKTIDTLCFPSSSEDRFALEAALRANDKDATAHYLLGTWYFARAMTAGALREWGAARELHTRIPTLDASLGWALLHETRDPAKALAVFEEGINNDSKNAVNYSGATAAMAVLAKGRRNVCGFSSAIPI